MKVHTFLFLILLLGLFSFSKCEKECAVSKNCLIQPESGPCKALFIKYYYDREEKKCKEFVYGGCGGVVPFETLEECKQCECIND
jgi:hypothetical protein